MRRGMEPTAPAISAGGAPLLGVTLATPAMRALAAEAVERWSRMTGLPAVIIDCPEDRGAHFQKLALPQILAPRPVCFFDADWWMLRPADPLALLAENPHGFTAVKDPAAECGDCFALKDCRELGLSTERYFNSGWFLCDLGMKAVRRVFTEAAGMHRDSVRVLDFGEQTYLNAAVQRGGVKLRLAPAGWNCGPWAAIAGTCAAIPAPIIGLHALGVPPERKPERLRLWASAFNPDLL